MSEFRYLSYTDFELNTNRSQNLLGLPIEPYRPTTRTNIDEAGLELNVPYTVFEILVAVFAIIGNLMVIIVFQRERKLRRRTNYYIVSLAIADFLVGLLGVPFAVLASIGLPTNLYACLFTVSLLVVLCTISIFCLVAVSVDRYWAILYPMAYSRNVRTKTAIIIISMCWVAGTVVGFLPLFGWHADVGPNQACLFVEVMDYDYLVFLYFATIITPALLMLAFYAHIYRVIVKQVRQIVTMNPVGDSSRRSSTSQIQMNTPSRPCHGGTMLRVLGAARKRDVKATQNLSIIVLFFMICWIPLYTINCIQAFCPQCVVHPKLTLFCIILSHLNSAVNPVLYAYHLKDFRLALKSLILKAMGVDVEQPVEVIHRFSHASQNRLNTLDPHVRPRIYIDSPIWLRQQQQQAMKTPHYTTKCGIVSPCLNNVNQTVAAVSSATTAIEREMWNIMEASSGAELDEVNYDFADNNSTEAPTPPPRKKRPSFMKIDRSDSPTVSYDNRSYSTSPDNAEYDEVFFPPNKMQLKESAQTTIAVNMREKLRSDDSEYQTKIHSSQRVLTDSSCSYSGNEVPRQTSTKEITAANGKMATSAPLSPNQPKLSANSESESKSSSNACLTNSAIYVIDNATNPLSPGHKRKFRKSPRLNIAKTTKSFSRSCSCSSDTSSPVQEQPSQLLTTRSDSNSSNSLTVHTLKDTNVTNNGNYYTFHFPSPQQQQQQQQQQHTNHFYSDKFSPLRAVSNFLFPPIVKHSSLFQLFQPSATSDTATTAATTTTTAVQTNPANYAISRNFPKGSVEESMTDTVDSPTTMIVSTKS